MLNLSNAAKLVSYFDYLVFQIAKLDFITKYILYVMLIFCVILKIASKRKLKNLSFVNTLLFTSLNISMLPN